MAQKDITLMTKGVRQTQIPRHSDNLQRGKGLVQVNHQTRGKYWHYRIQSKVYAVMYALVIAFKLKIGISYE